MTLTGEPDADGNIPYVLTVPNTPLRKLSFKKVDVANPAGSALEGATFDLYSVVDGEQAESALISDLVSGSDGMLAKNGEKVFVLTSGTYHLVETEAPNGYHMKAGPVVITVTADGVTYDEGTELSASGNGVTFDEEAGVYTLKISNSSGYELPKTGGAGIGRYRLGGLALVLLSATAGAVRMSRRRREEKI